MQNTAEVIDCVKPKNRKKQLAGIRWLSLRVRDPDLFHARVKLISSLSLYESNRKAAGNADSQRTKQRNEAAGLKATYVVYPTDSKDLTAPML